MTLASPLQAAEGMLQPGQLPELVQPLAAAGLKGDHKELTDRTVYPLNATMGMGLRPASFVSPLGLVVINHYCADKR